MAAPTDLELQLLQKFTETLKDLDFGNVEDPQMFLLRFLRARDHNVNKAEEMIRKHMEWRVRHGIDEILNWEAPAMVKKEYPFEVCGFDLEGCPVLVVPFGIWDVRKICELGQKADYVRYVDQLFVRVMKAMSQSSKVNGRRVSQFVFVGLPDNLPAFRQMSSVQAVDAVLETVRRFEANHPETLKAAFVIDTPKVFQMIFSVIKPLINSKTLGKVTIASNSKEWEPALLNLVSADQLPYRLGGTRPSNIPILNERKGMGSMSCEDEGKSFVALTVSAGKRVSVEFDIQNSKTNFSWAFKTDCYDIGFSVVVDGTEEVVPYSRSNAHQDVQCGAVVFQRPGKYEMVFDNSFSRWRSKVIRYRVNFDAEVVDQCQVDDEAMQLNMNRQMETFSL